MKRKSIHSISLILITILVVLVLLVKSKRIFLYYVITNSMSPSINSGSVVIVGPKQLYGLGEIVSFAHESEEDTVFTHRIVGVQEIAGERVFRTKGDANKFEDAEFVLHKEILGRVLFVIPWLSFLYYPYIFFIFFYLVTGYFIGTLIAKIRRFLID